MSLQGDIREFNLVNVLRLLEIEKKTGQFIVQKHTDSRQGIIYFFEGRIIHAVSDTTEGFESAIESICAMDGIFKFENNSTRVSGNISETNAAVFSAAVKRLNEIKEIKGAIISNRTVVQMIDQPSTNQTVSLSIEEWRILTFVDGQRDIVELADVLKMSDIEVSRTMNKLLKAGLIEAVDPRRKMIRQTVHLNTDRHPDPQLVYLDELSLDIMRRNQGVTPDSAFLEILTNNNLKEVFRVIGRRDLLDQIVISQEVMKRLNVTAGESVHVRLVS